MAEKITDIVPSETSDNDISIVSEGLIISSDLKVMIKLAIRTKKRLCQMNLLHLHQLLLLLLMTLGTSNVNALILMPYIGTFQKLWPLM